MHRAIDEVGYPSSRVLLFNNSILPIPKPITLSIVKTWPDNYICSVGRPSYQKNIELMIDVLSQIKIKKPDIHLVLMGVGYHSPNLKNVEEKIKDLNLENNITLLEWTKREDVFSIIADATLYLSTARYEGLPYSIIESLALGKPIVVTDSDGNRDLVEEGKNGYVVRNENATGLSNAVLNLINNQETLAQFSKHSVALFNEKFNIKKNIDNIERINKENKTKII